MSCPALLLVSDSGGGAESVRVPQGGALLGPHVLLLAPPGGAQPRAFQNQSAATTASGKLKKFTWCHLLERSPSLCRVRKGAGSQSVVSVCQHTLVGW